MIEGIREVAAFSGWDLDSDGERELLGRMDGMLAALVLELRAVRRLDVDGLAPTGPGEVGRHAHRS